MKKYFVGDHTDVPTQQEPRREEATFSLWARFDTEVAARRALPSPNPDTRETEIRRYLELPNLERHANPVDWWQKEKDNFKRLSQVALKYLVVQGTSVPSERVFSSAGNIISDKRSRLSDKNASMLVFLNANLK